jgi:hypothetical protein
MTPERRTVLKFWRRKRKVKNFSEIHKEIYAHSRQSVAETVELLRSLEIHKEIKNLY